LGDRYHSVGDDQWTWTLVWDAEMKTLYVASKLAHQAMWQQVRAQRPNIQITAHWIDNNCEEESAPGNEEMLSTEWFKNDLDVKMADYVLVYAQRDEPLRGALVEVGMGIAYGAAICVVGVENGTWWRHPQCRRFSSIDEALDWIESQA
jgi:hypothetical protein